MNRRNFIRNILIGGAGAAALAGGGIFYYVNRPEFGRLPSGSRLKKILASPHYFNDHFECLTPVKIMSEDVQEKENRFVATWKFLFGDKSGLVPPMPIPNAKTDLKSLGNDDCAIWMGHSTIYLQLGGRKILLDPVFSDYASPIFFVNRAFAGSNVYSANDFPPIDILAITHDHWDHLDYPSIIALKPKIKTVLCPLGVGEYFEQWDFDTEKIIEEDWDSVIDFGHGLTAHILPSQHFSGRMLTKNPTEWCAFAFVTADRKIFCSGDGGYSNHFKDIGKKFGGFDLAFMENGQYNLAWHAIHLLPNETAQASEDIHAKKVVPIHSGKFALARHKWNEPYKDLLAASERKSYELLTPRIGELINFDGKIFEHWFELEEGLT
ncbi:MAG: MBL fold metallo-hydrolase [Selenomonadaceae bacterium]|nr:MBL fold metallo-hydrolase [Selenomonadaceae bacterium]